MFFSVFPKSIETVELCGNFSEGASLTKPSIIEQIYEDKLYIISYDSIIRECLVFDLNGKPLDFFATIFTEQKYKGKLFREYMQNETI